MYDYVWRLVSLCLCSQVRSLFRSTQQMKLLHISGENHNAPLHRLGPPEQVFYLDGERAQSIKHCLKKEIDG
jgi:hypothetical protein